MPSEATINRKYIDLIPAIGSTGVAASNIPAASLALASGQQFGVPLAGHMARLTTTGKTFVNLPTGGNSYLPSCPGVNRFELTEAFKQKPALNAVLALAGSDSTPATATALAAYTIANKDFEVLGSNMTTALVTFADGGGIVMTTAGGANTTDASILLPHLDTNQTAWASTKWNTLDCIAFEAVINIAAVTSGKVYAGFKTTNTSVAATDDDQCYFVWDTANTLATTNGATQFVCVNSNNGSGSVIDNATDSGITVAAATNYHLMIQVDQNRVPYFFINGVLVSVGNGTALAGVTTTLGRLKTNIDLIPYIGQIQKTNSVTVATTVRGLVCSKLYND